jgi:uncharacterized delta-60 repeat protein
MMKVKRILCILGLVLLLSFSMVVSFPIKVSSKANLVSNTQTSAYETAEHDYPTGYVSEWNYTTNPSVYPDPDLAFGVAIDSDNTIVVVGYDDSLGNNQWRIEKLATSGESVWNYTTNPSAQADVANDVAVDSDNNIVVVGYDNNASDNQWRIMKINATGNLLWEYVTNPSPNTDRAQAVAVDSYNNIIVAGYDSNTTSNKSQWRIMKFNSTGSLSWWNTIDFNTTYYDEAYDIAVDSHDNIIVVGYDSLLCNYQWRIMKFNSTGSLVWENATNPSSSIDVAQAVAIDSNDNIIVVGYDNSLSNNQWRIMEFNAIGDSLWEYVTNPSPGIDRAQAIAVDSNDRIIVAGYDEEPGDCQWRVMKFSARFFAGSSPLTRIQRLSVTAWLPSVVCTTSARQLLTDLASEMSHTVFPSVNHDSQ